MGKFTKYGWRILAIAALLALAFFLRSYHNNQLTREETLNENQEIYDSLLDEKKYTKRDYEKEFYCEYTSNVGRTECLIENLDRASALREWKQRKIEMLKHPEVNIHDLFTVLSDETEKIKKWREGFEDSRDEGCIAEWTFRVGWGSGIPGAIAECGLNYEISALKVLDKLYYESILGFVFDSKGISDFEPTEKDIEKLMKSNKTERGCVWADDPACEYP